MKCFWQPRIIDDGYAFVAVFSDGHREAYTLYEEAYAALHEKEESN